MLNYIKEVQEADMLRSTIALQEAWDSEKPLTEDEMCAHLDALIRVVERKSNYAEFVETTAINNNSYLQ